MQHHGSTYFARRPPLLTLGWDQTVNIHFFSEPGHVAYQIKENHKCSNMVANILTAHTLNLSVGL